MSGSRRRFVRVGFALGASACIACASGIGGDLDSKDPIGTSNGSGGASTSGEDAPDGSLPDGPDAGPVKPAPTPSFVLQLLHASDMESGAEAIEDAPRFSAVLDSLRSKYPEQTLTLASGDTWIPGPFYTVSGDKSLAEELGLPKPGRTDVLMLNAMGFQSSCFGNHEFDLAPASVASLVAPEIGADADMSGMPDGMYEGAAYPYLSANLVFVNNAELGPLYVSPLRNALELKGKIAPSTIVKVGDQEVGVVGATTPTLPSISSPGSVGVLPKDPQDLDALARIIQAQVDVLTARGIDKVVLLAHMQQLAIEQALAPKLRDVDIIVAGGSNTLLADETDRLRAGDRAASTYPLWLRSATAEPIALVNTDGNYRYLGRLVVGFDEQGVVLESSVRPEESGAYATDDAGVAALADAKPIPRVAELATALGAALNERDGHLFGAASVYLDGRRTQVRTQETNLGNVTADANLWLGRARDSAVQVSIKNGGGIRADIGVVSVPAGSTRPEDVKYLPTAANASAGKQMGDISQFDIENALSFNNALSVVSLTAEELERVLEHAVAGVAPGSTPGQFFQIGGMRVSFDPTLAAQTYDADKKLTQVGQRIRNAAIVRDDGAVADELVRDGALRGDPARAIRLVTLTFLADGGDGYPFPAGGGADRVDLATAISEAGAATFAAPGTEQDALAEFLLATTTRAMPYDQLESDALRDERVQNLSVRTTDTVFR